MNKLKKQIVTNNELQAAMGERGSRVVDTMLTEMDAARMGAVDREVVRRDLIAMVQEREQMGCPTSEELDNDTIEMCNRIAAETGYRSRLEQQHYVVLCIATFFLIDGLLTILLGVFEGNVFTGLPMNYPMLAFNLVWYYVVYLGTGDRCLVKKKSRPIGAGWFFGLLMLAVAVVYILATLAAKFAPFPVPMLAVVAIDIAIFAVARHSYYRFINRQTEGYNLA